MRIEVISFGRKHGKLPSGFITIDCTSLPNPHLVERLREKSGLDAVVQDHLKSRAEAYEYILHHAEQRAKVRVDPKIAFVCIGGKHRSVAMAEAFKLRMEAKGHEVIITHTHLRGLLA